MAWAELNGIRMFYEVHGAGDPIVFAHGAGGNHLSWWQQIPVFMERHQCVVFDHRGFGLTADVVNGPGAAAYPDDLRALLDGLDIERAVLVAQSMGGSTCMGFAMAWPERVRGLVMADTTGTISDPKLRERMQAARGEGFTLRGRAYAPSLRDRRPDLAFLYDSIMATNPRRDRIVPGQTQRDERFVAAAEKLASFAVPTLFLVGEADAIVPAEIMRDAAALVPGARFEQVPNAGHSVYFEDAASFNSIVSAFIDSLP